MAEIWDVVKLGGCEWEERQEHFKDETRAEARAALLAALDPEDEALQQLWGDVIDRFSDPASHHCMATFFAELKAMAQGVSVSQEQEREKD